MFGFGVGEMAVVSGVITTLKSLNDSLATIKQAGANASQLTSLVSKYASLDQQIRDIERDKSGVLSVKAATELRMAKRQAANFEQMLKDSLLMNNLGSEWRAIMTDVEASRAAHEKEVAKLKRQRRERQNLIKEVSMYVTIGSICMIFAIGGLYLWVELFR
tara:strand:- start:3679 stop:4161 length:483 start_codon:yes stop_codon:yes gene_type:complete